MICTEKLTLWQFNLATPPPQYYRECGEFPAVFAPSALPSRPLNKQTKVTIESHDA